MFLSLTTSPPRLHMHATATGDTVAQLKRCTARPGAAFSQPLTSEHVAAWCCTRDGGAWSSLAGGLLRSAAGPHGLGCGQRSCNLQGCIRRSRVPGPELEGGCCVQLHCCESVGLRCCPAFPRFFCTHHSPFILQLAAADLQCLRRRRCRRVLSHMPIFSAQGVHQTRWPSSGGRAARWRGLLQMCSKARQ